MKIRFFSASSSAALDERPTHEALEARLNSLISLAASGQGQEVTAIQVVEYQRTETLMSAVVAVTLRAA
ncbi:MAG: hypothetical protein HY978_03555 [Candidatus Liptonbacteria bacterium]|nr:hypothetical protein [Candidatus Liptonbacteria bacterium]